jgi:hypothetical protein
MRENAPRSSVAVWLIAAVLLLPVVYVLSVGPMFWLHQHGGLSPVTDELIALPYAPLGWLRDKCAPFARALDWYLDFWR